VLVQAKTQFAWKTSRPRLSPALVPGPHQSSNSMKSAITALSHGAMSSNRSFGASTCLMWDPSFPTGCTPSTHCTSIRIRLGTVGRPWSFKISKERLKGLRAAK